MLTTFPQSVSGGPPPVWVDLLNASDAENAEAERLTKLRIPSREALSEIESTSRTYFENEALYLSLPLITPVDEVMTMLIPLGLVITGETLLTVRFAESAAFDVVKKEIENAMDLKPDGVFAQIFEAMIDKAADRLEHTGADLEAVSRAAFHADGGGKRGLSNAGNALRAGLRKIGQTGDRLSQIRDTLLGLDRISAFVIETPRCNFSAPVVQRLKAVHADIASLNSYVEHLANKVQFLLDATLGFINIEQNDIVKILTVVSVVGVPPVLIAGVYGMNFKNIPEYNWAFGYPYSLILMLVSAILPLAWFKWRGWL